MGIFDQVEKDAEDLARNDPRLVQQAGQLGQDMQAAQNMIGKQRGPQDQDQDQGQDRAGNDQAQDPSMTSGDPGQGHDQDQD